MAVHAQLRGDLLPGARLPTGKELQGVQAVLLGRLVLVFEGRLELISGLVDGRKRFAHTGLRNGVRWVRP